MFNQVINRLMRVANTLNVTNLSTLYSILTPARESSVKYVLNRNADNLSNLNELLTNALNVKNRKNPVMVNLSETDLKTLVDRYVTNAEQTITDFQDVYKYISEQDLENKLSPVVKNQFKQLLYKFRYSRAEARLLDFDPDEILKVYFTNCLLPLLKQNISVNLNLTYDDSSLGNNLYNFLTDYLHDAIEEYTNELESKNDLRLKKYLENHSAEFEGAKKQIIRIICSKKNFDRYIKANNLKTAKQIDGIKPGYIINFYKPMIVEYFSKVLKMDLNKYLLFSEDIFKYLELDSDYNLSFFRTRNTYVLPDTRNKIKVLETQDEPIGAETNIDIYKLDINNRERPFVVINDSCFIGRPGESHAQLIRRLQNKKDSVFKRDQIDIDAKSLAFGHAVNKLAFIETKGVNCNLSINELIQILKDTGYFTKVYTVPDNRSVIRLAKKRWMR